MSEPTTPSGSPGVPDASLLELLVCPRSKQPLTLDAAAGRLVCDARCDAAGCPRSYPIENGIPNLLL